MARKNRGSLLWTEEELINKPLNSLITEDIFEVDPGIPLDEKWIRDFCIDFISKSLCARKGCPIFYENMKNYLKENGRAIIVKLKSTEELKRISLYPEDENFLKDIPENLLKENPQKYIEYPIPILGEYSWQTKNITLYYSNIKETAKNLGIDFPDMFLIVLYHELVHATMDCGDNNKEQLSYSTMFGYWKEESYANAISLNFMNNINRQLSDKARIFMNSQIPPYKYGVTLFDSHTENLDTAARVWEYQKNHNQPPFQIRIQWLKKIGAL